MSGVLGTNLSSYPHLDVFKARSAEELKVTLDSIRLPYKIVSIYAQGNIHYAWVSLTRKVNKKTKGE